MTGCNDRHSCRHVRIATSSHNAQRWSVTTSKVVGPARDCKCPALGCKHDKTQEGTYASVHWSLDARNTSVRSLFGSAAFALSVGVSSSLLWASQSSTMSLSFCRCRAANDALGGLNLDVIMTSCSCTDSSMSVGTSARLQSRVHVLA